MTTTETSNPEPAPKRTGMGRRGFLASAGALAAAGVIAACSDDKKQDSSPTTGGGDQQGNTTTTEGSTSTTEADSGGDDLAVAKFAASVEVLGVKYYTQALQAAQGGKLGDVPPAVATFVQTAQGHHQAALDAWNKVLTGAGMDEVTEGPADIESKLDEEFGNVTDVTTAAKFATSVEEAAAATYLAAIPKLKDKAAIALAASIQPIDMQHVAVLRFVQGEYPVPDTFAKTDAALSPS